ncbi:MAG: hypothetical protein JSS49_25585 [Planctomycetes bacterium]|nr:hypothetical protein [Planctomycetota bacterium]
MPGQGVSTNLLCIDIQRSVDSIVCDIEDASEGLIEGCGIDGHRDETGLASTDAECCLWRADVRLCEEFDVRHPLPEQIAAWLREQASQLIDAAERIGGLDDLRDLDSRRWRPGYPVRLRVGRVQRSGNLDLMTIFPRLVENYDPREFFR